MKDRVILLIKAKNLTAAQFADEIGVQKSSISHILSGRNNASLDFIQKILLRYPEVNMEWLMFGKGPLFKGAETAVNPSNDGPLSAVMPAVSAPVDLFSILTPGKGTDFRKENDLNPAPAVTENIKHEDMENPATLNPLIETKQQDTEIQVEKAENVVVNSGHKIAPTKTILKIVEFYSDNTYREYFPE